jgi:hypothetical protein
MGKLQFFFRMPEGRMDRINAKCTIGNEQLAMDKQKAHPRILCASAGGKYGNCFICGNPRPTVVGCVLIPNHYQSAQEERMVAHDIPCRVRRPDLLRLIILCGLMAVWCEDRLGALAGGRSPRKTLDILMDWKEIREYDRFAWVVHSEHETATLREFLRMG